MTRAWTTRRILCVTVPVAALILTLLLLRGCIRETDTPQFAKEALFVPGDLARLKQLDRDGVLDYCRTQIRPANYEGILRGAHGALWAGEANAWDRVLLAAAALEGMHIESRVVPGDPPRVAYKDGSRWMTVRVDVQDAPQESEQAPAEAITLADLPAKLPDLFHTIQPVFVLERDGGEVVRADPAASERLAGWAYEPVLLRVVGEGPELYYAIQVGDRPEFRSPSLQGCRRVRLELTWRYKDQSATWARELFDVENAKAEIPGHDKPRPGDRYAIVVAAGPLVPDVLPTRARMMELPGYTPVDDEPMRELIRLGTKYQVDSDERTRKIADYCKVDVAWTMPRITIAASEVLPGDKPEAGLSLDALADGVEATGAKSREFHVARGMATDLVETRVVYEARGKPVVSTSTVFSNFKADSPDSPTRRVAKIETEARRLLAEEPIGSTVVLTAMPPRSMPPEEITKTAARPTLLIERIADGVSLRGLSRSPEAGRGSKSPWGRYEWKNDASAAFADGVRELAVVADAMLARKSGHLDYTLQFDLRSVWPRRFLPIARNSVLTYLVQTKEKSERLAVDIGLTNGQPTGAWTSQETNKRGTTSGKWPDVLAVSAQGAALGTFLGIDSAGQPTKVAVRVGENVRELEGRKVAFDGGSATILANDGLPIILEWQRGDLSLRLESATPVVRGTTRDTETGLPAAASVSLTRTVNAAAQTEIDLRKWSMQGPARNGNWKLASDGRSVTQTLNGEPTFFVSPDDFIETTIRGKIRVDDTGDHDYIGFVLGYRSPIRDKKHADNDFDFLLFDWRKTDSPPAKEGFALSRVRGNFAELEGGVYAGLWNRKKSARFETLASSHGRGKGWKSRVDYSFEVNYKRDRVQISIDGIRVLDVKGKFEPGRFGFYAYSQADVRFSSVAKVTYQESNVDVTKTDTAADGSFALAVAAPRRRLILVLDRSGSMSASLDPKDGRSPRDPPAPKGQQRIDYLRKAVHGLLDKLPGGVEVALWSFSTGPVDRDVDNPRHTRVDCPFTTDLARVRKAVDALKPDNGTPITGAVHKVLDHVAEDPLSANAQVVLLTDGENSSRNPAAKAYHDRNGTVPIHTIGFAIEPGGKAEGELRDLAEVSGGKFHIAGTGEELALAFDKVETAVPNVRLAVKSTCHSPVELSIPAAKLGGDALDVPMTHGCATCKCTGKTLLTVRKDTIGKLAECNGLSPKARAMIEERVKDGKWCVTIPTSRVNLGEISAYAWWETEDATGRMVGRTEDGLHGASIDPRTWPDAAANAAGNIPFVAWYEGIVAYTMGSVDAAMRWTREPGFMAGGPEGFKRFVQANALDFSARWWSEVGASAFPENMHNYWSGVCLNYTLQSAALGLPATNCFRHWAGAICDQAAGAAKDIPKDLAGPWFDDHFGEQYRKLYGEAKELAEKLALDESIDKAARDNAREFVDELNKFKKAWDDGVDKGFDCNRFRPEGKR
jgi:hypothetical protein